MAKQVRTETTIDVKLREVKIDGLIESYWFVYGKGVNEVKIQMNVNSPTTMCKVFDEYDKHPKRNAESKQDGFEV